jgi:beta-lactamase regulating signal transducer with metallopeptidase domain
MHAIYIADAVNATLAGAGSRLIAAFSVFAQAVAPAAVDALWQGAAVAVALVLSLRLAPRVSAAHRFGVWTAGFAVVACLPFLPWLAHAAAPASAASASAVGSAAKPWFQLSSYCGLGIAALWLAASLFRAVEFALHTLRLRRLWRSARPIENEPLAASLNAAIGWRKPVAICTTRQLDRPSVIGFFAPRILIPEWLLGRLTAEELQQVVLHEAEHLRRRDDWSNLLQKFSLVLFPLNPALAWMERRLCREREMACDEGVVRRTQAPRAYAACLTSLAERSMARRAEALSLGAFGRRSELVRRVHSVLRRQNTLHPVAARALVSVMGCSLLVASVELARCPQTVEFAATPKPHALAQIMTPSQSQIARTVRTADEQPGPFSEAAPSAGRVRAVEAMAVIPASTNSEAPVAAHSSRRAIENSPDGIEAELAAREPNFASPHQVLLKAEMPDEDAAFRAETQAATQPATQYVVLTAWERVETFSHRGRHFADYDTAVQDSEPAAAGASQASAQDQDENAHSDRLAGEPQMHVTIVHMILAVYPAPPDSSTAKESGASAPAAGAAASSSTKPANDLPFAPSGPASDSGWLVLQL